MTRIIKTITLEVETAQLIDLEISKGLNFSKWVNDTFNKYKKGNKQ